MTIVGNVCITNIDHEYADIDESVLTQGIKVTDTKIGDGCFIGFGAVIQAGTTLGTHCVVGANAVVRGTFSDYSVIVGALARIVKRYNAKTKQWEKQRYDRLLERKKYATNQMFMGNTSNFLQIIVFSCRKTNLYW